MHDLKEGMSSTFATAWHDAWFRKQVEIGLKEADALATDCVTHATVELERAQWRAELQKLKTPIT
jgi:hypothetical protein